MMSLSNIGLRLTRRKKDYKTLYFINKKAKMIERFNSIVIVFKVEDLQSVQGREANEVQEESSKQKRMQRQSCQSKEHLMCQKDSQRVTRLLILTVGQCC